MKRKSCVAGVIALILASLLAACSPGDGSGSADTGRSGERRMTVLSAGWARGYDDIGELAGDSDLIALVKIEGISDVYSKDNLYFTAYKASVVESLYGGGSELEIVMTGADTEKVFMQLSGDPLMAAGELWVIFARKNDEGSYTILSGPYGRFSYDEENKTVTSMLLYRESGEGADPGNAKGLRAIDGMSWDTFAEQVQACLD